MADCYGCPYRWHDTDCEYCSAQNDMILDLKSIKKEDCPIYQEYEENRKRERSASGSSSSSSYSTSSSSGSYSSSSSGSSVGCGIGCAVVVVIIILIALLTTGVFSFGAKKEATKAPATNKTAIVYNVDRAVNMREKPDSDSEHIVSIPKGETVEIVEKSGKWYLVKYGEYEGYCYGKYLDIQD